MNQAKKFLKDRLDLTVTKADKGKHIVVMKTEDYKRKMNELVNDTETYVELSKDPTTKTLKLINTTIDKWVSSNFIEKPIGRKLKVFHCNPPRAYGLPKTHKEEIPLRLIVSTIGTATYKMAKFLTSILNGIVGKTEHHVNNSFQFAEEITKKVLPVGSVLFSLDVVSLFTNVPVDYAIQSVELRWTEIAEHTDIEKESFIEMLRIVLQSNFFQLNGKIYAQKFGVPMGSPLSPVIASIALERIEKAALEALSERDIIPVFYKRYVDDCLVCAKLNEQQSIMDMFNGMHQRLKFTIEQEVDGKIKFLDMIIRREEGGLTTEWFPKDENGRYLDFGSEKVRKGWTQILDDHHRSSGVVDTGGGEPAKNGLILDHRKQRQKLHASNSAKQVKAKRISAHKSSITKLDMLLSTGCEYSSEQIKAFADSTTALIKHCVTHQHRFDLAKASVLDRTYQHSRLNTLETFHIKSSQHAVNYRSDVENMSHVYAEILHTVGTERKRRNTRKNSTDPTLSAPEPTAPLESTHLEKPPDLCS
ncbi:uncharacterized protein LOC129753044 [Uranotaenia lowii]|uniref:uncharacterized protein LOC129753044 n=1 Tax=Uranotaenia lowii TaxID=190385 RepID=UPI002478B37F|nr:uncharacterized protein LOC129753044 [Uranotaenia lowii]